MRGGLPNRGGSPGYDVAGIAVSGVGRAVVGVIIAWVTAGTVATPGGDAGLRSDARWSHPPNVRARATQRAWLPKSPVAAPVHGTRAPSRSTNTER
jgi:hypothetical protein